MSHLHLLPKVTGQPSRDTEAIRETSQRAVPPVTCTTPGGGPAGPPAPGQALGLRSLRGRGRGQRWRTCKKNVHVWAPESSSWAEILSLETGDLRPPGVRISVPWSLWKGRGQIASAVCVLSPCPAPAQPSPFVLFEPPFQTRVREEQLRPQSRDRLGLEPRAAGPRARVLTPSLSSLF